MALVTEEHGGLQGLVTADDILETIVGAMSLAGAPEVVRCEDGSWSVDGMLPVGPFKEGFDIREWPTEERRYYQSVVAL